MLPIKIYVTPKINEEPVYCLLVSGCKRSVIAYDLIPSHYTVFAANRADLPILGDTDLQFTTDGQTFEANVSMSKGIYEMSFFGK